MVLKKKRVLSSKAEEDFLLPEKELAKAQKKYSDPNYSGGSLVLDESASVLDKTKYRICEKILSYKYDNKLTTEELAERVNLSIPETKEILFCHIHKFTLDHLNLYLTCLLPDVEYKIFREYQTIPRVLSSYLLSMLFISNINCKADRPQL